MDSKYVMTVEQLQFKKHKGEKISMITAYDYPLAALIDEAGVDVVLVGDSLANVVLGLKSTRDVGLSDMLYHCRAVRRAVKKSLVVGDMPYSAYQQNVMAAADNAFKFIDEAGCGAVKLEWFDKCLDAAERIVKKKVPLMGHVGLTPQTADFSGGFKVRGTDEKSAKEIIDRAVALQNVGCFSIVLECVPQEIAKIVTERLTIPTIGIGAGAFCDGQVLVLHDILGLSGAFHPKFTKSYVDLGPLIKEAVKKYNHEVKSGAFPDDAHSFHVDPKVLKKLQDDETK